MIATHQLPVFLRWFCAGWGVAILFCLPLFSQAAINEQIPFQGNLKDNLGAAVADGNYDMVFRLYDAASGGTVLWTGTYTTANSNPVTVTDGTFRVLLGSGTGNTLSGVDFNSPNLYLGLTVEADTEMTPRQRFGAVPYAFNADTLDGFDASDFLSTSTTDVTFVNATATNAIIDNLTITGPLTDSLNTTGTTGYVLQTTGTGVQWVATSSLGIGTSASAAGGSGAIQFSDGAALTADAANLFWDNSTNRLGIGTTTPSSTLTVDGTATITGTVNGRNLVADGSKLDGIESGATADQTPGEILTALLTVDGAASGLDADLLDGLSAAAFVLATDVADLSGVTNAATARSNLGLVIGTDIQAFSAILADLADGTITTDLVNTANPWADTEVSNTLTLDGTANVAIAALSAGSNGQVLQTVGGTATWVATSSLGIGGGAAISFGTDNQLPFMNAAGDDFEYSSNLTFDGTELTLGGTGLSLTGTTANVALGSNWLSGDGDDEGVFVDSNGNVGIGTTTPSNTLTVAGSVQLASLTGGLLTTDATGTLSTTSVSASDLADGSFGAFTVTSGVATLNPTVVTDTTVDFTSLTLGDFTDDVGYLTDITGASFLDLADTPNSFTANQILYMSGSAVTSANTFTFDGTNLGIGTPTPTERLTVADGNLLVTNTTAGNITLRTSVNNGNDPTLIFEKARGGVTPAQIAVGDGLGSLSFRGFDGTTYNQGALIFAQAGTTTGDLDAELIYRAGSHRFQFDNNPANVALEILSDGTTFFDGGNVGIGTTSPSKRLEVFETVADAQLRVSYDGSRFGDMQVDSAGTLIITSSGNDVELPDDNLWVCESGSCPAITASSTAGYGIFENGVYFGNGFKIDQTSSSSPELGVYDDAGGLILIFD